MYLRHEFEAVQTILSGENGVPFAAARCTLCGDILSMVSGCHGNVDRTASTGAGNKSYWTLPLAPQIAVNQQTISKDG